MSTCTKLTQKVDRFTVFESFPSTSCCSKKFPLNKVEKSGWLDMQGSIRDIYMGKWQGMDWREKVIVQNCDSEAQKPS